MEFFFLFNLFLYFVDYQENIISVEKIESKTRTIEHIKKKGGAYVL